MGHPAARAEDAAGRVSGDDALVVAGPRRLDVRERHRGALLQRSEKTTVT